MIGFSKGMFFSKGCICTVTHYNDVSRTPLHRFVSANHSYDLWLVLGSLACS